MGGAIPPLYKYAFMAWCSVKKKSTGLTSIPRSTLYPFYCFQNLMKEKSKLVDFLMGCFICSVIFSNHILWGFGVVTFKPIHSTATAPNCSDNFE
jgi:hypothetical protein